MPSVKAETPDNISLIRSHVIIHENRVAHPSSTDFPCNYLGEDLAWDVEKFRKALSINVIKKEGDDMEFDLIGVDASIANAFRRILIGEVPTMAIEKVYIINNTGIMHDEIIAQRLGLIPIKADPRKFDWKMGAEDPPTDLNTIVLSMDVTCKLNTKASTNAVHPSERYVNSNVYSGDLTWIPQGGQEDAFKDAPVKPIHEDILITKLRPGQTVQIEAHCQKGIGKEHAKWSPVATASYRLLPEIMILKPIPSELCHKFQSCFPKGVIKVEKDKKGKYTASVDDARNDTVSREVLRHHEFKDHVLLTRKRDHFIFNIESTGILPPDTLFLEAVDILIEKCNTVKKALLDLSSSS